MKKIITKLMSLVDSLALPADKANHVVVGLGLFILLSIMLAPFPAIVLTFLSATGRELLGLSVGRKASILDVGYTMLPAILISLLLVI